jgi:hypothetical protein
MEEGEKEAVFVIGYISSIIYGEWYYFDAAGYVIVITF